MTDIQTDTGVSRDADELRPHPAASWPIEKTCPFTMPPEYAALREEQPIASFPTPTGKVGWLVTRHEDVQKILLDPRVTADRLHPAFPSVPIPEELIKELDMSLVSMDPPIHTERRALLIPEFTVKRMHALRPRIQRIVDDHITAMLEKGPPADLMEDFALPVPSLMICELLGVPLEHHEFVQKTARSMISISHEERFHANRALLAFMAKVVEAKEGNPTDDLFGRLIVKNREAGLLLDRDDMVAFAKLLLLAGHETSANMISLGTVMLLRNPEQLAALKADPSLMPNAVEELLRYFSITDYLTSRGAKEDIEIGGVTIRAGDAIIALCGAGNRDPEVYPDPDELDIRRKARNHLGFGHGVHQCLGQNMARMELEIAYGTLFRRIPTLRLAVPVEELPFKDSPPFGVHSVPVEW